MRRMRHGVFEHATDPSRHESPILARAVVIISGPTRPGQLRSLCPTPEAGVTP